MAGQFLMLAKVFTDKHQIEGQYVSEKLDGTRCYWDGGVSRGVPTVSVPWANVTNPKTGELKKKILPFATGLWSRNGNVIAAPDWWLNELPSCPLDGELWAGVGTYQECRSIVGCDSPDERWYQVQFAVFGSPPHYAVYGTRHITGANIDLNLDSRTAGAFLVSRLESGLKTHYQALPDKSTFEDELQFLRTALPEGPNLHLHKQTKLSKDSAEAKDQLDRFMGDTLDNGGEGLMLRSPGSVWTPKRSNELLKLKPFADDTTTLVGFTSGRETNKGSKNRGKIGALITNYKGMRLELSGMTDVQRMFLTMDMEKHAYENPGKDMPGHFLGLHFKPGDTIEFRYVSHKTDAGLPKEARFKRVV